MQLKINNTPFFTPQILDVLEENVSAFGKEYFTADAILKIREQLLAGILIPRCSENAICYEIILGDATHVGDIILTPTESNEIELDIIIFLPNSGYGSTALTKFVNHYRENYRENLSAMILNENPIRNKVEQMFIKAGFIKKEIFDNGVYLQLER
ncbi:hypothetical protein [Bacillus thuringiensis]|uniref:hypothetical protein n=1 Tax=Bacillus thuringiensis TaxID=1428 RepID=UPI000BFCA891|nr:hypothetical protein [Bacillus thuringiensis]PGH96183.1 hypothetical protein CN898_17770 [Bacillus thuringiensis]